MEVTYIKSMSFMQHKQPRGFTIVELLIVIVVIAILAAISIVAYNGIQQRAKNTARISAATSIAKAIDANTIATGSHLPGTPVCIPTGGKDYNADGIPDCGPVSGTINRSEKTITNAALSAGGVNNLKFPTDEVVATDGQRYTGVQMTFYSNPAGINGTLQPYFLYFYLDGENQDCKSSASISLDTAPSDPLYRLTSADRWASGSGYTVCAYSLKHQSTI